MNLSDEQTQPVQWALRKQDSEHQMNILDTCTDIPFEEWKTITGNTDYEVSNYGRVASLKKGRNLLKIKHSPRHYPSVCLSDGKERKYAMCHRLVAEHFLKDWNPDLQVDHIDGDKYNCHVSNLRIVSATENQRAHRKSGHGSSRYRGVSWNKKDERWVAFLKEKGRSIYLGSSKNEGEAAVIWNREAANRGWLPESMNILS